MLVKDIKGNPLSGASVYLGNETEMLSYPKDTSSSGKATYKQVISGAKYYAGAEKDGYYFKRPGNGNYYLPDMNSADWKDTIEIEMVDAHRTQAGKVVDESGAPVAKIKVRAMCGSEAVTDANGEFVLKNMPDEKVSVYADTATASGSGSADKDTASLVIKLKDWSKK